MLTHRDLTVALITAVTTIGLVVLAQPAPKPVMGSSIHVFKWNSPGMLKNKEKK